MAKKDLEELVIEKKILNRIYVLRGEKVMIDKDLAELYNTKTKVLKQAVKRNLKRFPRDFMFQMTSQEFKKWREGAILTSEERQGLRYALGHKDILLHLTKLEKEVKENSKDIENIFVVLRELIEKQTTTLPRNKIGFLQ